MWGGRQGGGDKVREDGRVENLQSSKEHAAHGIGYCQAPCRLLTQDDEGYMRRREEAQG
jgi:hypothetical protein